MPTLSTPRGRFFYRLAPGHAPTLIFLHSNLGTSLWWRPVLDLLPAGWQGIAYDAIGYGHSDRTNRLDRFTVSAQMLDLAAIIEALDLAVVHVVAHSNATPVAIELALAHLQRVASLILVGPVPAEGIVTPPEAYPLLERLPQDMELLTQAIRASAPALAVDSPLFAQLLADGSTVDGMALVAGVRGLDAWQAGERLRALTLPVLLVRGEHDVMLSDAAAHASLLAMPGANNLEIIRGAGHSPMVETPQGFAQIMLDFIDDDWQSYTTIREQAEN